MATVDFCSDVEGEAGEASVPVNTDDAADGDDDGGGGGKAEGEGETASSEEGRPEPMRIFN